MIGRDASFREERADFHRVAVFSNNFRIMGHEI